MIVFISSRVNDGFSFCQLHFPLPCPVCFADTHNVYDFKGHFSSYLRNVTTSIQCTYIPVSDLLDVLGVYQWPIQPGGACWTGHSAPLIKVNFSAFGFCDNRVLWERVISPQPNLEDQGITLSLVSIFRPGRNGCALARVKDSS